MDIHRLAIHSSWGSLVLRTILHSTHCIWSACNTVSHSQSSLQWAKMVRGPRGGDGWAHVGGIRIMGDRDDCTRQEADPHGLNPHYLYMKNFSKHETIVAFVFGCLTSRLALAGLPLVLPKKWLPLYGIPILALGIGFLYLFFSEGRLKAPEGGGKTWWASFRLVHGALYLAAAVFLFRGDRRSALPLSIDVILGAGLFTVHRLMNCL